MVLKFAPKFPILEGCFLAWQHRAGVGSFRGGISQAIIKSIRTCLGGLWESDHYLSSSKENLFLLHGI